MSMKHDLNFKWRNYILRETAWRRKMSLKCIRCVSTACSVVRHQVYLAFHAMFFAPLKFMFLSMVQYE